MISIIILHSQREEITYAELQLPSNVYSNTVLLPPQRHHNERTVYAQIDTSLCHSTVETPLIGHPRESTV